MFASILKKIFGTKNERELKQIQPLVAQISELEPQVSGLSDAQLRAKTDEFKKRVEQGETRDDLLCDAFAVVREASKRTTGMRHFDVQLIGGIVLHQGKIAEMKTGEGKTLVATLSIYLNALTGEGVHLVTVNDYLARRDARWMGPIYHSLGLSVGVIQHEEAFLYDPHYEHPDSSYRQLQPIPRKQAYEADITYGTNNEFGFDYLRDNMVLDINHCVQRQLNYAIVDEVDSILIDEARTPLIISGPAEESTELYCTVDRVIPLLQKERDYQIDEKARTVMLTEEGVARLERALKVENLYDPSSMDSLHHAQQALKAHTLFRRDTDYVVKDGEVIIVDEFTGRLMPGRRYSEGLHQALEAKEKVKIANENQTLATITFQNYFRLYKKLAGMTGTADTEAVEFHNIYNLDVVVIPTNRSLIRTTYPDAVYRTEKEKFNAAVAEIEELCQRGRPVLVGTISIEKSELLSRMLKRRGIKHHVLNAKHHEREAEIIAQAGQRGAVTIATNMAGRGTDIVLGEGVAALDGLHILGTERHEARRIDNQLRGRAGRQGDPGSSRFYLSLEDDLLRIFGSDRISGIMGKLGMEDGQPIEHRLVTRAIENAQRKVEAHNFDIRKHLLEYDDVLNKQREVIYHQRRQILEGKSLKEMVFEMLEDALDELLATYVDKDKYSEEWELEGLAEALTRKFALSSKLDRARGLLSLDGKGGEGSPSLSDLTAETLQELLLDTLKQAYERKEHRYGEGLMRHLEKMVMLQVIDSFWKDHLLNMDHLKEGIGLRGYAHKDPLIEYKKEGYEMFMEMVQHLKEEVVEYLFRMEIQVEGAGALAERRRLDRQRMVEHRGEHRDARAQVAGDQVAVAKPVRRDHPKVGRNDPCPCGSGKKYKRCCGVT